MVPARAGEVGPGGRASRRRRRSARRCGPDRPGRPARGGRSSPRSRSPLPAGSTTTMPVSTIGADRVPHRRDRLDRGEDRARRRARPGLLLDQQHVPRPRSSGAASVARQQVVDRRGSPPGTARRAGSGTPWTRPVMPCPSSSAPRMPEHGRAVLLGLEGPEPAGVTDRRREPPVGELLVRAAPLVLDVGDAHAGARGRVGDAEPGAVVLEGSRSGVAAPGRGRPAPGRRPADRGGGAARRPPPRPRPRVEARAMRRASAAPRRRRGRRGAAREGAPRPALEPGQRCRGSAGRARRPASGVGRRGRHQHRGEGAAAAVAAAETASAPPRRR